MKSCFFKNHYLLATILLWVEFSFMPIYAETEATYYAFVTHKLEGRISWQHVYLSDKLLPGLYRFQIVVDFQPLENASISGWHVLQGEFQFIDDPQGGVKINNRLAFNERDAFSAWLKVVADKWVAIREKKLQPILTHMKQEEPLGHPDPNLMRFLVLKKGAETFWQIGDKNYRLYRLHYFDAQNVLSNESKKVLSRFINPGDTPTTDFKQLKRWVDNQEQFTLLTLHATTSDDNYADFYRYFQTWFNQWFEEEEEEEKEEITQPESWLPSYWLLIFWGTVFVVIVLIIGKIGNFSYQKLRHPRHHRHKPNDNAEKRSLPRPAQKMAKTSSSSMLSAYMQKEETELSRNEVRQLHATISHLEQQLNMMNNKLIELEERRKVSLETDDNGINHLLAYDEVSKMVWKALKDHFSILLSNITSKLLQDTEFKKTLESHINTYLHGQFNNDVNRTLELYANKFWEEFINENQGNKLVTPTQSQQQESSTSKAQSETQIVVKQETQENTLSQSSASSSEEMIKKIKTTFLNMKAVDEAALNLLDVTVGPCTFITNVVANCLKLNQPVAHYQRLDNAIRELTEDTVSLIIANIEDHIHQEEHHVIGQSVVEDKLTTVATLIRPGVKCNNIVRRKAEVNQKA